MDKNNMLRAINNSNGSLILNYLKSIDEKFSTSKEIRSRLSNDFGHSLVFIDEKQQNMLKNFMKYKLDEVFKGSIEENIQKLEIGEELEIADKDLEFEYNLFKHMVLARNNYYNVDGQQKTRMEDLVTVRFSDDPEYASKVDPLHFYCSYK